MRILLAIIMTLGLAAPLVALTADLSVHEGRLALQDAKVPGQMYSLKGEWRLFPNAVLPLGSSCPEEGGYLFDAMFFWNAEKLRQLPEIISTSSFCLEIDNPTGIGLSFWWPERILVDVYGNGELLFGSGELKDGKVDEGLPRQTGLIHLPHEKKITVIIHANNEFMRWRKVREDLFFGSTTHLSRFQDLKLVFDIFVLTSILITGFYQFSLFLIHRDRRETLYLGFFCVALAARYSALGHSNFLSIVYPSLWGEVGYGLGYVAYYMAASCFYQFLWISYQDLVNRWVLKFLWVFSIGFSIATLLLGHTFWATALLTYHALGGIAMLFAVYAVVTAFIQKRKGSLALALGTLFLTLTAWADMARSQGVGLEFDLFPIGQIAFVTAASLLVSIRFSHAFDILSHLSQELSKIVPLHVIPLLRSGTQLEECMPTGEHDAVVLVFDVVGSSRVTHPDFRKALDVCMARFFDAINQDYDAKKLEATGYRVKEMGDGVICTVGFPFKVPHEENPDSVALHLAEQMCAIFHQEMARLETAEPIYCGIGLARGLVDGFFPRSGQKQYDLRGFPLTLATRYEAMRNQVYNLFGRQGSVIFIHDAVYQKLGPDERHTFQHWETSLPGHRIRDDEGARQAWFKFVASPAQPQNSSVQRAG